MNQLTESPLSGGFNQPTSYASCGTSAQTMSAGYLSLFSFSLRHLGGSDPGSSSAMAIPTYSRKDLHMS